MAGGLTRAQIGVTEAMIAAYGDVVFRLSNNLQQRRGDPIRLLDLQSVERQRAALGMSDAQIAARVGLSLAQVTYIRNLEEVRRMRTNNFHRLLALGGGRRFRADRFTAHEDRPAYSDGAMGLRAAMQFPPEQVAAFVASGQWGSDTLRGWLSHWAAATPERPALITAEGEISYRELFATVRSAAAGLRALGLVKGDVVAVQLPNTPAFLIAYLAIAWNGGVMTTLYLPHRTAEYRTLLRHSGARAVICADRIGDFEPARALLALRADGALPALEQVVVAGDDGYDVPRGTVAFAALAEAAADALASIDDTGPVAADPVLLLYTSGTTASPKGVPHPYQTVLSNARLSLDEHGITGDDVLLSAPPFGHLFALYAVHLALAAGAANLLLPVFSPPALAELIAAKRPSVLLAAPAHMAACLQAGLFDQHPPDSLRLAILSGSALPPALARSLDEKLAGGGVTQLWGMTETQAGLYTRPGDGAALAADSAGRPSPGTEARIVDEAGAPVPAETEGELQVRGPLLFPGYLHNDAANAEAFTVDGWFRSGDLARCDAAGNITITGRIKDVINRGGVKYNPRDIEELLERHPAVAQAAIVPLADAVLGERACACVVLYPNESVTLDGLCDYLLGHGIAKTKLPERLAVVEQMPLTPTRKVIKGRLAAQIESVG